MSTPGRVIIVKAVTNWDSNKQTMATLLYSSTLGSWSKDLYGNLSRNSRDRLCKISIVNI